MMRYLQVTALTLTLAFTAPALAGSYAGLEPGVSTQADANRALGEPVRQVVAKLRYEYRPDNEETARISISFHGDSAIIQSIDIYPAEAYRKAQYRDWFELAQPDTQSFDADGSLVEVYEPQGMELHYAGVDDATPVRFFRHYDRSTGSITAMGEAHPGPAADKSPDLLRRLQRVNKLEKDKDWEAMKSLVDEGLKKYPDCADLWYANARYHFEVAALPRERRSDEILRSVTRAYELEPTAARAMDLGWIHLELFDACTPALYYFEKAAAEKGGEKPVIYYWMGVCSEETRQPGKASEYYARFLDIAPGHNRAEDARWRLGALLDRRRD